MINFLAVIIDTSVLNIMSHIITGLLIVIIILIGFYLFHSNGE